MGTYKIYNIQITFLIEIGLMMVVKKCISLRNIYQIFFCKNDSYNTLVPIYYNIKTMLNSQYLPNINKS